MERRVVITGIGTVSAFGLSNEKLWESVRDGKTNVSTFDFNDGKNWIGSSADSFDTDPYIKRKIANRMDKQSIFGFTAAKLALQDSGLELNDELSSKTAVYEGSALGHLSEVFRKHKNYILTGKSEVSPYSIATNMSGYTSSIISIENKIYGPSLTFSSGCVSSSTAIGQAYRQIKNGYLDVIIAGGAEAPLTKEIFMLFDCARMLAYDENNIQHSCKPFDKNRKGLMMGEGSAFLVLEDMDNALQRDTRIYGEIIGYGESSDAFHPTSPDLSGVHHARAIEMALKDAKVHPSDIDYFNAHGTGTSFNDITETNALKIVFKDSLSKIPVSSTKPCTGHLLGSSGAIELAISLLAINNSTIPGQVNYEQPDECCDLNIPFKSFQNNNMKYVMNNNLSFGGRNTSLIIKKFSK